MSSPATLAAGIAPRLECTAGRRFRVEVSLRSLVVWRSIVLAVSVEFASISTLRPKQVKPEWMKPEIKQILPGFPFRLFVMADGSIWHAYYSLSPFPEDDLKFIWEVRFCSLFCAVVIGIMCL